MYKDKNMAFPELIDVKSDSAWPLVRLSTHLEGGKLHVSYLCDKHTVDTSALDTWLSNSKIKNVDDFQTLKHKIYHDLMPKALQMVFVSEQSSMSTREIQPGLSLPKSLEDLLNDELTKRTIY